MKLKLKFYRTTIRPAMLCCSEFGQLRNNLEKNECTKNENAKMNE